MRAKLYLPLMPRAAWAANLLPAPVVRPRLGRKPAELGPPTRSVARRRSASAAPGARQGSATHVAVMALGCWTPRIDMHMCVHSSTTRIPRGCSTCRAREGHCWREEGRACTGRRGCSRPPSRATLQSAASAAPTARGWEPRSGSGRGSGRHRGVGARLDLEPARKGVCDASELREADHLGRCGGGVGRRPRASSSSEGQGPRWHARSSHARGRLR